MPQQSRPLIGILLVIAAVFCFATGDVLTKYLTERHPVGMVVAGRYVVSLILLTGFAWPRLRSDLWRTRRTGLVLVRGLILTMASLTMGYAVKVMPVAETVSIIYLSPFVVMILAVMLFGETVRPLGWMAAVVGFAGVLVIMRPGSGLDPVGVVLALINAMLAATYQLMTRRLSATESTFAMLFHVTWIGAVFFSLMALGSWGQAVPGPGDLGLMAALGVAATMGHFLFTAAYRHAPASMLAPINYFHLVWAGGLGWLVFGHLPTPLSLLGMAMVAGAGVAIALMARRRPPLPA